MTKSLKSCFPVLGEILGETPAALYARQLAFVRIGLLKSVPGRGPGSGVHASAESLALFVIGMLTNASATEKAKLGLVIANGDVVGRDQCMLTGARKFKAALAKIIGDSTIGERVREIRISSIGQSIIHYTDAGFVLKPPPDNEPENHTLFAGRIPDPPVIRYETAIYWQTIRKLNAAAADCG